MARVRRKAAEWAALLHRYPSVGRQFARARPVRRFVRTGRVQRRARRAAGDDWAMLAHAAYFREHGPQRFCAYPPVELPAPEQVTGRAGDLLLAHYLLGHNIGGNFASDQTRRALYYRVSATGHDARRAEFLQDPWLEYAPVRGGTGRSYGQI